MGSGFNARAETFGIALARLAPDGAVDPTFGDGGFVFTTFPCEPQGCFAAGQSAALLPDGRILVGGIRSPFVLLARYLGDEPCSAAGQPGCRRRFGSLLPSGKRRLPIAGRWPARPATR